MADIINETNVSFLANPPILSGKTYTSFGVEDIVTGDTQTVTEAMWTGDLGTLTTFATQSSQQAVDYYLNVYDADPDTDENAEIQFSVAYGNIDGKGASEVNTDGNDITLTPSKAIYSQYRNLLLEANESNFVIDSSTVDQIIAINIQRERLKEKLDKGNWELTISGSTGYSIFIDDSSTTQSTINSAGEICNIVSGSLEDGVFTSFIETRDLTIGKVYLDRGILIINADTLSRYGITMLEDVNTDDNNHITFYNAIEEFKARNEQKINSTFYFVRVKNSDYNFSNNPSYTTGSLGDLKWTDMYQNSKAYITTVGMYNENKELLAVAKLSQPLIKNFQTEALIRVKIDW